MKSLFIKIKNIIVNPLKGEIKEIKKLKPTEEDYKQGERIALVTIMTLTAMGIPMSAFSEEIIAKAAAYALRDLKDGLEYEERLIVKRIVNEIKANR